MENREIDPQLDQDFQKELSRVFDKRTAILFWVGFLFFPAFSILDYFVVHEHFYSFLVYRCLVSVSLIFLLVVLKTQAGKKHPLIIALAGYVSCGSGIALMVVQTGGYDSFYYVGMICVLVTFSSILPLNAYQSVGSGILMHLIYVVPVLVWNDASSQSLLMFFNNNFFFLFFLVVSVVKSHEDYRSRQKEYWLKKNLNYYAGHLEQEVKKRIKKHEESELRYKSLYENIMDSLVLIDTEAVITMANSKFYELIKTKPSSWKKIVMTDLVLPEDFEDVHQMLNEQLFQNLEVRDFQFRILNHENETIPVECNARAMEKNGNGRRFQLVIRDITARKRLEQDLIASFDALKNTRAATIMGLAKLTEYRDNETGSHLERIQAYSRILATELGNQQEFEQVIDEEYIENLCLSSILHDIGKVGIPDAILLKPGRLTPDEFSVIQKHCQYGGDALNSVETRINGQSFLIMGKEIAYYHHEKWNGAGYPYALKGTQIPLSARIVAVADVYDALTSKRTYKDAYSHDTAVEIISDEKGQHFDPDIVDAFMNQSIHFDSIRRQI